MEVLLSNLTTEYFATPLNYDYFDYFATPLNYDYN